MELGPSSSWIVTVRYGDERLTLPLHDYLQRQGLDASLMQFPALPKHESLIRLFVTSEHDEASLDRVAKIVIEAGDCFGFARSQETTQST